MSSILVRYSSVNRAVSKQCLIALYVSQKHAALPPLTRAARSFASESTYASDSPSIHKAPPRVQLSTIRFDDTSSIFRNIPTSELLRSGLITWSFKFKIVYQNMPVLLAVANRLLGKTVVTFLVKHTLFQHFCGGETLDQLLATGESLAKRGLGTIVDYAAEAEADVSTAWMDSNVDLTNEGIRSAGLLRNKYKPGTVAYLAMKPTALCQPALLTKVNYSLNAMHSMFAFGVGVIKGKELSIFSPHSHDILMTKDMPFDTAKSLLGSMWPHFSDSEVNEIVQTMANLPGKAPQGKDKEISYFQWMKYFTPERLWSLPPPQIKEQPTMQSWLQTEYWGNQKDIENWEMAIKRIENCYQCAIDNDVALLIDAETTWLQSAIDYLALKGQEERGHITTSEEATPCYFYNTYQMYAKCTWGKLLADVERADRMKYKFGAKIVCGAYMSAEAKYCEKYNLPYPIHDTFQDTRKAFDNAMQFMIERLPKSEVCCASHNEDSVRKAAQRLGQLTDNQPQKMPIAFAHLYAMADYLSLQLANAGALCFKYTPYGHVNLVLPYLVRRAEENSSIFGHGRKESAMYWSELRRRAFNRIFHT